MADRDGDFWSAPRFEIEPSPVARAQGKGLVRSVAALLFVVALLGAGVTLVHWVTPIIQHAAEAAAKIRNNAPPPPAPVAHDLKPAPPRQPQPALSAELAQRSVDRQRAFDDQRKRMDEQQQRFHDQVRQSHEAMQRRRDESMKRMDELRENSRRRMDEMMNRQRNLFDRNLRGR
jgi:hypothetical protein